MDAVYLLHVYCRASFELMVWRLCHIAGLYMCYICAILAYLGWMRIHKGLDDILHSHLYNVNEKWVPSRRQGCAFWGVSHRYYGSYDATNRGTRGILHIATVHPYVSGKMPEAVQRGAFSTVQYPDYFPGSKRGLPPRIEVEGERCYHAKRSLPKITIVSLTAGNKRWW